MVDVAQLNVLLAGRTFVDGHTPTQADVATYDAIGCVPPGPAFPHVVRFHKLLAGFSLRQKARLPGSYAVKCPATAQHVSRGGGVPAPAAGCVLGAAAYLPDGGDLWGDEGDATVLFGDEDPALDAANERRLAAIREAQRAKRAEERALAVQSGASRVVLDVKPWDDSTDLAEMERQVRRLRHPTQPEAIQWQVAQREDVGYGIHKLRIMCQVVDEVVSVEDDLVARIEGLEEWVQSCDVFGFNNQ